LACRRYDDDGSGELDLEEFLAAVRSDCNIASEVVADEDVGKLFKVSLPHRTARTPGPIGGGAPARKRWKRCRP
jgi:hypothetical protein